MLPSLILTLMRKDCYSYTSELTGFEELGVFLHACNSSTQEVWQNCEFKAIFGHVVSSSFKEKEMKLNVCKPCLLSCVIATLSVLETQEPRQWRVAFFGKRLMLKMICLLSID